MKRMNKHIYIFYHEHGVEGVPVTRSPKNIEKLRSDRTGRKKKKGDLLC